MDTSTLTVTVTSGREKISPGQVKITLTKRVQEIKDIIARCTGEQRVTMTMAGLERAEFKDYRPEVHRQCDRDTYRPLPKRSECSNLVFFVGKTVTIALYNILIGCSSPGYGGRDTIVVRAEPETIQSIRSELSTLAYANELTIQ